MTAVGDRIGCVTVLDVLEAAQARERDLRGYRGRPVHPKAMGSHVWVRCDCHLEFLVRAREVTRRKDDVRCGKRCEIGKPEGSGKRGEQKWRRCRNTMCGTRLRSDNRTGFCRACQERYPGRRWFLLTHPERLKGKHKHMRALRSDRKAAGFCVVCLVNPHDQGRTTCESCRTRHREYKQQRRDAGKRGGTCRQCPAMAQPGVSVCSRHREIGIERSRKWRENAARKEVAA